MESFNGRFTNKLLIVELFISVQEARQMTEQHRIEYNTQSPQSMLHRGTGLVVFQQWRAA
jgi:hypothetical protein